MSIIKKYEELCEYCTNSYNNCEITLLGEKISVISTRPIDELFTDKVKALGLHIESISFSKDRMYLKDIREF